MTDVMVGSVYAVVARSDASFAAYVADQQRALQNFAFLVIGNWEDARDAVQEALIGAYRHWDRVQASPGHDCQ